MIVIEYCSHCAIPVLILASLSSEERTDILVFTPLTMKSYIASDLFRIMGRNTIIHGQQFLLRIHKGLLCESGRCLLTVLKVIESTDNVFRLNAEVPRDNTGIRPQLKIRF